MSADHSRMVRWLAVSLAVLVTAVSGGVANAGPSGEADISKPADALRGAHRTGNLVSVQQAPEPPPPPVAPELQAVLDLVNAERTARGLVPLRFSDQLNQAAQVHTERQAAAGSIFHTDPGDGSNPGVRISRTGYSFSTWGENVAAGYRSPQEVMTAWMNSSGHCRNILNPAFTELGVGYVANGVYYGQFWTQVFARPKGEPRPAGSYNSAWC